MNVYGMARSFHEEYGITVRAYAEQQLAPTRFSKIVKVTTFDGFSEDPVFIEKMRELIQEYKSHEEPVILIGCGDGYAELIAKHKAELEEAFICPYVDYDMLKQLNNKERFYELAEKHDLPHPKTEIITKKMYENKEKPNVEFGYPVSLKPANSVEWLDIHFEGRKKAFTIHDEAELLDIIGKIYDNGYTSDLILQDFIPGDDSNMRVLNAYVDKHHRVKMMCLGHPLLEDPTPQAIGNYVAILPEFDQTVYDNIQKFLEEINYTGYANFDMKYDSRDGQYKLFEINIRMGRSSFYVTLNGYNLAKWVVEDYVNDNLDKQATVYGNKNKSQHKLWLGVPIKTFKTYAKDNEYKDEALDLIRQDRYGTTVFYKKDMSPRRWVLLTYMFHNYVSRFNKYFQVNKGQFLE